MKKPFLFRATLASFLLFAWGAALAGSPDAMLVESLQDVSKSNMNAALSNIDALLKANPNFRLAQLVKGDILLAHARPISNLGDVSGPQERIHGLREEARVRMLRESMRPDGDTVPNSLIELDPAQKYAIVVDLEKSALYLYKNVDGKPQYVADYYVTSGQKAGEKLSEGDKKTPIGVYYVTGSLPAKKLGPFYGSGAYPLSYPNEWDRHEGRSGHGIWLHGTPPDTYSRVPKASSGCVVLSNLDLDEVSHRIQIGSTPVVISDSVSWVKREEAASLKKSVQRTLDSWRRDWESRDIDAYLGHYSRHFFTKGMDYSKWAEHKALINSGKSWVKVEVENVSAFLYPGAKDLFVVSFDQVYSSNNLSNKMRKKQYWIKEKNEWKIVYEGEA